MYLLCIAALRPCPRVTAARLIYQVNVGTEDESHNTRVLLDTISFILNSCKYTYIILYDLNTVFVTSLKRFQYMRLNRYVVYMIV